MPLSDEFRDGVLLPLSDGHPGFVDCQFDGPEPQFDPDSVQRNEFRSTQLGSVSAALTITKTQPRLATLLLTIVTEPDGESDTFSP